MKASTLLRLRGAIGGRRPVVLATRLADGAQVLSHSHDGEVRVWDTGFASETDASPERIAAACASKLRGTGSPGSGGVAFVRTLDDTGVFRAPILRGREGEDVCTAPPVPWWETAAGAVFGWMFR